MPKAKTYTRHAYLLDDGTELDSAGYDLEESFAFDPEVIFNPDDPNQCALLFSQPDDDCFNPLDDCDGLGKIWHHPCSGYGKSDDYYSVLGLDHYGAPIIDEDKLQALWHDKVMALPLKLFQIGDEPDLFDTDAEDRREALADEGIVGDYTVACMAKYAWSDQDFIDIGNEGIDAIEAALAWDYTEAERQCAEEGDPDALLLDVYEHGLRSYSLSGHGMQCRWDTSRGEAVWVPDDCARDEIDRRARVYAFGEVQEHCLPGKPAQFYAVVDTWETETTYANQTVGVFEHWHEAHDALVGYLRTAEMGEPTAAQLAKGRQRARYEIAKGCVEAYDNWQRGECFGLVCLTYTQQGEVWMLADEDTCWGYVGSESTKQSRYDVGPSWVRPQNEKFSEKVSA